LATSIGSFAITSLEKVGFDRVRGTFAITSTEKSWYSAEAAA
jgi:hypothetical protein